MEYKQNDIRRQDRLLDENRAEQLLRTAEYGVLSMTDAEGRPYGIPLNYVWDESSALYIHCAPEGRKLRALAQNAAVSFCIVGSVHLLPSQFTTEYESIVLQGRATIIEDDEEKRRALHLLINKLAPNDLEAGAKGIERSLHRTAIIRMDVTAWSGKRKQAKAAK